MEIFIKARSVVGDTNKVNLDIRVPRENGNSYIGFTLEVDGEEESVDIEI